MILAAGTVALAAARPAAAGNPLTVVVANGPYAGTYHARADEVICLHAKKDKSLAASFKDFEAKTPRTFAEGGLRVDNSEAPGPKRGWLYVAFGTSDKKVVEYTVYDAPITMTVKGKGADLVGTAKTKEGVSITVTASCTDIDTM
ncbi:MAG: hypothetical protein ABI889_02135 [Gemmatimonadota bacterium]